jgi:hypothetical protein
MTDFNPKSNASINFLKKTKKFMRDFNPKSNASTNFRKKRKKLSGILIENQMRP